MFKDKMTQKDDIEVLLKCGRCGEPANSNHNCTDQKLERIQLEAQIEEAKSKIAELQLSMNELKSRDFRDERTRE